MIAQSKEKNRGMSGRSTNAPPGGLSMTPMYLIVSIQLRKYTNIETIHKIVQNVE